MGETYNMPLLGLFGKRCRIKHVSNMEEGFVYRIVSSGIRSNTWKELPLGRVPNENVRHNYIEDVLIVVCDTLIDDCSKLERVRLKDVEIMNEPKTNVLDNIRAEILEEKDYAYADFDQYKIDYLGVDAEYVKDELPQDDFRYGMERCVEIINKYRKG